MSIVTLVKTTVVVPAAEQQAALLQLQQLGLLHLIALNPLPEEGDSPLDLPAKTQEALRYLLACPQQVTPCDNQHDTDLETLVQQVLDNQSRRRALSDRCDQLREFIKLREEWGDFEFPPLEQLAGIRFWFYVVNPGQMHLMHKLDLPWQVVGRSRGRYLVVVLAEAEPGYDQLPLKRVRTGAQSLHSLKQQQQQLQRELDDNQLQRVSLTRWRNLLAARIAEALDCASMYRARQGCLQHDGLCVLQGWLPAASRVELIRLCDQHGYGWVLEEVAEQDQPPTLLKPPRWAEGARRIVEFFQIPNYRSWDPSPVIWLSFCLFYAMILSDAGYAALLAVVLLFLRRRIRHHPAGRVFLQLGVGMSLTAMIWGVLVGSYFGGSPPPHTVMGRLQLLDLNNFNHMMRLSVGLGVCHLVIATLAKAWALRNVQALAPLGWSLMFSAGFVYWLVYLEVLVAPLRFWAQAVMGLGALLVVAFSDTRPINKLTDLLWRLLGGLKELTGISKGFGDVLSYLRLFALGLSSAQLALTFNGIAFDLLQAVPGIGILLCVLVLLFGHLLNLALAVMGGVIHGLRLNLIEFHHWGIGQEGYAFKAFAKQEENPWNKS